MHGMSSPGLGRTFGVNAAGDLPLVRPSRSRRTKRASAAAVGAVSGVSVLVLVLLGAAPALPGLFAAFGLGLLAARMTFPTAHGRAVVGDERYARLFDQIPLGRLHELDRERVLRAWSSWISGDRTQPFRAGYRLVGADGRDAVVDDVTSFVPGHDGLPTLLQRHLRDVTRERQLEEQLRQAQRLELLGRVAAGIAHDFNNLLAVISGYATRLSTLPPREARDESGHAISAAAERGASLVRQLLAFSRPQPTDSRVVDLNELVSQFAPMLRRVIGEDVELELRLDAHRLPVEVHPVQIDQVLMNVVVNARDAMPTGGRLTVSTWKLDETAVVTVADTGVGMDSTTQDRIFEPFFSTKEPGKGSGLGLSTAHGIVRHAGGSLTVSSTPGEGTTFGINLPLAAHEAPSFLDAVVESTTPVGGPETVLVVEDEAALRELERLMLEEAGYDVLTASNAAEALTVAGDRLLDLLVVDVVMPGLSGPQLVDELHARGYDVPVVFISGYGADEISSRGLNPTNAAVVEKPFQAEELLRRVRDVLDRAARAVTRVDAVG